MDSASTAVNNLLSSLVPKSAPAPGTRDGGQTQLKSDTASSQGASGTTGASASAAGTAGGSMGTTSGATNPSQELPIESKQGGATDTTVDQEVAPAVEHETVTRKHEEREQTVVEKERHKDHYHTTIQPLKDREVQDTEHDSRREATEYREINKDDGAGAAQAAQERSGFQDTSEEGRTINKTTQEATVGGEQVHHHLHETIQPVIEKETVVPSVTHVTKPVHEKINEGSENHGVTTNSAMSIDEFKNKLSGEATQLKDEYEGKPSPGTSTDV